MNAEPHALHAFFGELVKNSFHQQIGLRDPEVQDYITAVLVDFVEREHFFKLHDFRDRPLSDVGEMLLESDPVFGPAPSFDRERQVRKHIGDYILFLLGMFPESINHDRLRRARIEQFVSFLHAGKESYHVVSMFDCFEYAKVAPLFAKLSDHFELCVRGLNTVRSTIDYLRYPLFREDRPIIL